MSTSAIIIVAMAILLPAALYIALALRIQPTIRGLPDFFPLTRFVPGDEYGRSTASAGVSLATVILAIVNLAPFLGLGLLVTVASYVTGFVVLYFCIPTILKANPTNATLQSFLGTAYRSKAVRNTAFAFSFAGYISIFSMELLVGVTVIEPFMGSNVLLFSALYLIFIVTYSIIGGFRAVVSTEQWQIRFVVGAVLALLAAVPMLFLSAPNPLSIGNLMSKVATSWAAPLAFSLGIIAMNVPAAISDSGTWQRLCATRSVDDAKKGIRKAIPLFILIWGSLIVGACVVCQIALATGQFAPAKGTLMTFIVSAMSQAGFIQGILLFVFMLGLFAAMITTADSLLLVAAQMLSLDIVDLERTSGNDTTKLFRARLLLAGIAVASFLLFFTFKLINFDVVQLIFSIYGANLALFPATAAALFLSRRLDLSRSTAAALLSIGGGFSAAWASALYAKASGDMNWMYNAPVIALAVSVGFFAIGSIRAWTRPSI